jgi:hypothetical protein
MCSGPTRKSWESCKTYVFKEEEVSTHRVSSVSPRIIAEHYTDLSIEEREAAMAKGVSLNFWGNTPCYLYYSDSGF